MVKSTSDSQPSSPRSQGKAVLEQLCRVFPVFRNAQPLAIGIDKSIRMRLPEISSYQLSRALDWHTGSMRYLKALANGEQRFDLDGNPCGVVTAEQRDLAKKSLVERFRKTAERRQEEQAVRQRQEKLQKLAEKFSGRR